MLRRGLGLLSLGVLVYLCATLAAATAAAPSRLIPARYGGYPDWLRGPLSGISFPISRNGFVAVVIAMFVAYLLALACVGALRARWTIAAVVLVHLAFLLGPPLLSADVMGYLDWARMGALHGLSPYVHDSGSVVSDAVFPFVRWDRFTSPYGPVFTLLSYALVPLGVGGSFWALKVLAVTASLGICAVIWDGAGRLGLARAPAVALYGLNPAVLVFALGGFHNDLIAIALVMGGVLLVLRGRDAPGGALAVVAIAVKASTGVVLPFLVLGAKRRGQAVLGALAAAFVVVVSALAVFGSHAAGALGVLSTQQGLSAGSTVIAQLGAWFGWSGNPAGARAVAGVLLVVVVLFLLWRTWRGAPWVEAAGWATLAVLVATSWLLPWYVAWLLPLAALAPNRWLRLAAIGFSVFVVATRFAPLAVWPTRLDLRPVLHPAACLLSDKPGCPGTRVAIKRSVLQPTMRRGFRRSYLASERMVAGKVTRLQRIRLRDTRALCRPLPGPRGRLWTCDVGYFLRLRPQRHHALYTVYVDPRGCFTAVTNTYPLLLPERVLGRPAANPLSRINHCP